MDGFVCKIIHTKETDKLTKKRSHYA